MKPLHASVVNNFTRRQHAAQRPHLTLAVYPSRLLIVAVRQPEALSFRPLSRHEARVGSMLIQQAYHPIHQTAPSYTTRLTQQGRKSSEATPHCRDVTMLSPLYHI